MSKIRLPKKVKLVISFFSSGADILNKAEAELIRKFGKTDYKSSDRIFEETDYYEKEMGKNLLFRMISFEKLVERSKLPQVKHICWKIENKFCSSYGDDEKRAVNIDPGILSLENFVLATGKGFAHRIYLSKGVYADLTLIYKNSGFTELPWTYLNYRNEIIKRILTDIRNIYFKQLKK